ncbi:uncharacterized protein LOC108819794 [Raphanus sativus]|uniref:Uncharacterized protein LOC108819794 n=1 Tax=Raphanus sativus TaxID=3726 RepID=A0A6J0KL79_RAPSA|nr:uncharacterized protein LOC108819794 [Raphanus sativus]
MQWNQDRIEAILPHLMKEILLLQPSKTKVEDSFIWQPLPSGIYTTRSGYFSASMQTATLPFSSDPGVFTWVRDVWSEACSPKMKLFLWSIIQRALPLGENLQQRGMIAGALCKRCNEVETAMHTFFHCPYAQEVWHLIPLNRVVHLATDGTFKEAVVAFKRAVCLPPTGITSTILPWVCWTIWNARNQLLFEGKTISPADTATAGLRLAHEWTKAQDPARVRKGPIPQGKISMNLRMEDSSVTTCRTDAAWDVRSKRAGMAWILTDSTGTEINRGSTTQNWVKSPLIAEAMALRSALLSAETLGLTKLRCFSDNATLIRAITTDMQAKEIFGIVRDIKGISSVFVEVIFSHFNRSFNVEADSLAKLSLSSSLLVDPVLG